MPFEAQHKIFKRLAEIADSKSLTKEEQEKYDNSMMVMWDNYAVYKHAMEKEAKKVSKEIALNLLTYNTPIDVIAKSTGLSIEEIRNWNNNTIRIIKRVCHKWDDMPSFFSLFQPLLSANSATSFS